MHKYSVFASLFILGSGSPFHKVVLQVSLNSLSQTICLVLIGLFISVMQYFSRQCIYDLSDQPLLEDFICCKYLLIPVCTHGILSSAIGLVKRGSHILDFPIFHSIWCGLSNSDTFAQICSDLRNLIKHVVDSKDAACLNLISLLHTFCFPITLQTFCSGQKLSFASKCSPVQGFQINSVFFMLFGIPLSSPTFY